MSRKHHLAYDFGLVTEPTDHQVFEKVYKKSLRDGEEMLMLAVLEDAVQCFQEYVLVTRPREKRLFQEAEEWFLDKESDYIFSFEFICETLGFHPDHIRQGLMTWKDSRLKITSIQSPTNRPAKLHRTRHIPRPSRLVKAG